MSAPPQHRPEEHLTSTDPTNIPKVELGGNTVPSTIISKASDGAFVQQTTPLARMSRVVLNPHLLTPFAPGPGKKPVIAIISPLYARPTVDRSVLEDAIDVPENPHATDANKLVELMGAGEIMRGSVATLAKSLDTAPHIFLKGMSTAHDMNNGGGGDGTKEPSLRTALEHSVGSIVFETAYEGLLPVPGQIYTLTGDRDGGAIVLAQDGKPQIASFAQVHEHPELPVVGSVGLREDGSIELHGPGVLTGHPFPPSVLRLAITTLIDTSQLPEEATDEQIRDIAIEPKAIPDEDLPGINMIRQLLGHEPLHSTGGVTVVLPDGRRQNVPVTTPRVETSVPSEDTPGTPPAPNGTAEQPMPSPAPPPENGLPEMVDVTPSGGRWPFGGRRK